MSILSELLTKQIAFRESPEENKMKIISKTAKSNIATVYVAESGGKFIEFVESTQPPTPREKKWVLIISTLYGCPVNCKMCDAGGTFAGKISKEDMLWQIAYMVNKYFPGNKIPIDKFKIQFARMGEPAFNNNVIDVLTELPEIYQTPGLTPSISTIAPSGCEQFFTKLIQLKNNLYSHGKFQMQFSIHTTDQKLRDQLIPITKWNFAEIANYGEKFFADGDRKITLNFALAKNYPLDTKILRNYFSPELFLIKITPVNLTLNAKINNLETYIKTGTEDDTEQVIDKLTNAGYEALLSVGELEENRIGSNCGQFVKRFLNEKQKLQGSYEYELLDEEHIASSA
jgi:23S rRNA (adenine2503-C2)-methyltransferase